MHPYSASLYTTCVMTQLTEGLDWVITHSVPFAFFVGSNEHIWCRSYFYSWEKGQDESQRRRMPSIMKYKQSLSQAMRLSHDCGEDKKKEPCILRWDGVTSSATGHVQTLSRPWLSQLKQTWTNKAVKASQMPLGSLLRFASTSAENFWVQLLLRVTSTKTTDGKLCKEILFRCCDNVVALMSLCTA